MKYFLPLLLLSVLAQGIARAQNTYPARVTGHTADVIADGQWSSTNTDVALGSTSAWLDGPTSLRVLYCQSFRGNRNTTTAPPYGLDDDGMVRTGTGIASDGYKFMPFNGNNGTVLSTTSDSAVLMLEPYQVGNGMVLGLISSEGNSTAEVKAYGSGVSLLQQPVILNVNDWFRLSLATAGTITDIGRVSRSTDAFDGTASNPHIDLYTVTDNTWQGTEKRIDRVVIRRTNTTNTMLTVVLLSVTSSLPRPEVLSAVMPTSQQAQITLASAPAGADSVYYEVYTDSLCAPATLVASGKQMASQPNLSIQNLPGAGELFLRANYTGTRKSAFIEPYALRTVVSTGRTFSQAGIVLYPNPAQQSREAVLKLPEHLTLQDLYLTSTTGQRINLPIAQGRTQLLQAPAAGVYMLTVQTTSGHWHAKWVVQ